MRSEWLPYIGKFPVEEYVRRLKLVKGGYWAGCFGQRASKALWDSKRRQRGLEKWYLDHSYAYELWEDDTVKDCIGVDKEIRWGDGTASGQVPYKSETDLNESMLYELAEELNLPMGKISTIPQRVGICVGYKGHIGFVQDIINGKIFIKESRGGRWGVVVYELGKRPGTDQQWEYWFENPFIDYGGKSMELFRNNPTQDRELVKKWQRFLKYKKYNLGSTGDNKDGIDGGFGEIVEGVQKQWEKSTGLTQDGKVNLGDCLIALDGVINDLTTINTLLGKEREKTFYLDAEIAERQSRLSKAEDELASIKVSVKAKDDKIKEQTDKLANYASQILSYEVRLTELEEKLENTSTESTDVSNMSLAEVFSLLFTKLAEVFKSK